MGSRHAIIAVTESQPTLRLDTYLRSHFPMVSRSAWQRLIEEGQVLVNAQKAKLTQSPRAGDEITIHWPEPTAAVALPEDLPLDICFEDEDLLVLNKTAGVVVHPAAGHDRHTLVNALLHHCEGQLSGIGGVMRPGIVHRLDKETSGCLVVAKNDFTHVALSEQFAARTVTKTYQAIVCGVIRQAQGEIRAAIARHPSHRKRMAVTEGAGRAAHTSYQVRQKLSHATLVDAQLHTGRTHQIRVHFEFLGYPLLGDSVYGLRQNRRIFELTNYRAARQMLHAHRLAFIHPRLQRMMEFAAPIPADFAEAIKALQPAGAGAGVGAS